MPRPPFNLQRTVLRLFAFFGSTEAKAILRAEKLRRLEAEVFIENLTPAQRKLPKKRLLHKFNHKHPN